MASRTHGAKRTTRGLCIQPLEARRCLAVGFAQHPIGGHLLGGSTAMTVGDLNGDGHLDFVSSRGQLIGWRANDGQGNFGENRLVTTELDQTSYLVVGDVDGDGDNDVVAVSDPSDDDELVWFENRDGLGTFGPKRTIAEVNDRTRAFTSGDLDGDGDLDFVRSGFRAASVQYVEWFENVDGSGRFDRRQISDKASFATVVVDLDHDGDPDIVTDHSWLENVGGEERFIERSQLIELEEPDTRLGLIDDVDNDGRLDLFATVVPWGVYWYEATDDPTDFEPRGSIGGDELFDNSSWWYSGDVDGDRDQDLVAVAEDFRSLTAVHWYELRGTEYVSHREAIASGVGGDWSLIVADLNSDLRADVLFYHGNGSSPDVFTGATPTTWQSYDNNSGTFGDPIPINDVFHSATGLATADIDGDGDLDVIHSTVQQRYFSYNADVAWIENLDGSHAFGRRSVIYTERQVGKTFQHLWPSDIDGDGDVDIAAIKSGEPVWFENLDGKGNFGDEQAIEGVPADATLLVYDLDGDQRADLLAVNEINRTLDWYSYDTPGAPWTFERVAVGPWPDWLRGVFLASDLDGDGDQDLAFSGGGRFDWFERLDAVSFAAGRPLLPGINPGSPDWVNPVLVALADMDGDEDLDVVYSESRDHQRPLAWLENQGGGLFFRAPGELTLGEYNSLYALGDLEGDEDLDIVSAEWWGVRWLENRPLGDANGDGRFDSADLVQILAAGKYEDDIPRNTTFDEGDWNGDGEFTTADLVLAMQTGQYDTAAAIGNRKLT